MESNAQAEAAPAPSVEAPSVEAPRGAQTATAPPSAATATASATAPASTSPPALVKYGELIILGYNGTLPQGDRGRRRSKFALFRRPKGNGVTRSKHYKVRSPETSQAILDAQQHSISYTLSRNQAMIVEYTADEATDLFQIGRSSESPIDFVVMDTVPGNRVTETVNSQSTISRFACRIISNRDPDNKVCKIYAAGFNSSRNIFLGEKATKWQSSDHEVDGLTTNGVLIMHPSGEFCPEDEHMVSDSESNGFAATNGREQWRGPKPGIWREISVGGEVFGLRESRSAATQGEHVPNESNVLRDGTLIDLCGATLLWRSAAGLDRSPNQKILDCCVDQLNAGRPQCPVGLHTLQVPTRKSSNHITPDQQPIVYLSCGHVQGKHNWGEVNDNRGSRTCPICLGVSATTQLTMGMEPAFYVDCPAPEYCFVPCGHMASERTVKYWANVPIPCGTSGFQSACPFCAVPLTGEAGYVKLIFQNVEN